MSHHHAAQPETHGAGSPGHAPQVAVRDGNRLLCPCCGEVLLVLPNEPLAEPVREKSARPANAASQSMPHPKSFTLDEIVRRQEAQEEAAFQAAMAEDVSPEEPSSQEAMTHWPHYGANSKIAWIDPKVAAYEFPEGDPPPISTSRRPIRSRSLSDDSREPRERDSDTRFREWELRRAKRPLREPQTYASARLFAWTYYRLKTLNIQLIGEVTAKQDEIDALKRELNVSKQEPSQEEQPRPETPTNKKVIKPKRRERVCCAIENHPQEALGVGSGADSEHERGPP
ncbi:hypothetical protein [Bremerella sp. P1]|uniref:hypothetical protein n=1 Tax=Bremerella sp. P1 TaxID=3026424 RepID=UPI002368DF7E|nr:hypothetical protein [Bremerella sp. P1]WDI42661.1 hypothetical protein PSR63_01710 [Bremerella sp. P1]